MKKYGLFVFLLAIGACSTSTFVDHQIAGSDLREWKWDRKIASTGSGLVYSASQSFDMNNLKGQTYITFLKKQLKPALDKFSDRANGGGGGFDNIGSELYRKNALHLDGSTLASYKGARWNRTSRSYEGGLSDAQVESVFEALKKVKPRSTTDSLCFYDRKDPGWPAKNDMVIAAREARVSTTPFDLCTLYALTSGIGVKVKIDDSNYNYHVLYKTGKTNPHEEVMSGRSFASSIGRGVADATDPEYLRDLQKFLSTTPDQRSFYRALVLSLANTDSGEWKNLSNLGQAVLSDFLTVYTAEAIRHLMVNLKDGVHPWEIDLAAVTVISSLSAKTGKVVAAGKVVEGDLGRWFAPSPNNVAGGPQRSGIGITRRDRVKLQRAIHRFEMLTRDGAEVIKKIQAIIGIQHNTDDVIQGVFEYLSNPLTPASLGWKAGELADLVAQLVELAREDAEQIIQSI